MRRINILEEEGAKSRTQSCVFTYPDLCISRVAALASELSSFCISADSLDEKKLCFSPHSLILSRLDWGHEQEESSYC